MTVGSTRIKTICPFQTNCRFANTLLLDCIANLLRVAVRIAPAMNQRLGASSSHITYFTSWTICIGMARVMTFSCLNVTNLAVFPITTIIWCAYAIWHSADISSPSTTERRANTIKIIAARFRMAGIGSCLAIAVKIWIVTVFMIPTNVCTKSLARAGFSRWAWWPNTGIVWLLTTD